jgi:phage host-nuclease inhibitor protein Gam
VVKDTCQICNYKSELWALEQYPIVPVKVTQSISTMESRTVLLCRSCRQELEEWYLTKVSNLVYDTMRKRFRERSCLEMIREYEHAYHSFVEYKRKQRGLG